MSLLPSRVGKTRCRPTTGPPAKASERSGSSGWLFFHVFLSIQVKIERVLPTNHVSWAISQWDLPDGYIISGTYLGTHNAWYSLLYPVLGGAVYWYNIEVILDLELEIHYTRDIRPVSTSMGGVGKGLFVPKYLGTYLPT